MSDVTHLLAAIEAGDMLASAQLFPLVCDELRRLAAAKLARERVDRSLEATALVHEAYLRLVGPDGNSPGFASRGYFFAAAAEAMRRILVDRARERQALRRGGGRRRLDLHRLDVEAEQTPESFLALHEALSRLEEVDHRKAELVKLRFFAGLTSAQTAEALGVSKSTADNDWAYARAWLRLELEGT
jgi:RNA polymerase sigma factor (TIGR02999 family)